MITLEFKDFRTFLDKFSANVSKSGMFVEADEPEAEGSEIEFELGLTDGEPLLKGNGEVAWVSGEEESDKRGMGVRFLDLDSDSEKLVQRIEEIRTKSGRKIFDLERGAESETPSGEAVEAANDSETEVAASAEQSDPNSEVHSQLQADLETALAERDELAKRLSTLEELAGDGSELDTLRGEMKELHKELEQAQAEVEKSRQEAEEQATVIARFSEQGKYAMAERDRLDAAKKSAEDEVAAARAEVARLEGDQSKLDEVKEALAEEQAAVQKLEEEVEAARAEVAKLEEERVEFEKAADEAKEADKVLAESQASLEKLQEELAEARTSAEKAAEEARQTEAELNERLNELEETQAEMHASLEGGQTALDEVRSQFEESASRVLELEHEASSTETQLSDARERIAKLEAEQAEARTEISELTAERDAMGSDLAVHKMTAKRAKRLSDRVRKEHTALQEDFAEVQATLEELREASGFGPGATEGHGDSPVESIGDESESGSEELAEEPHSAKETGGARKASLWAKLSRLLGDDDEPYDLSAEDFSDTVDEGSESDHESYEDSDESEAQAAAGGA